MSSLAAARPRVAPLRVAARPTQKIGIAPAASFVGAKSSLVAAPSLRVVARRDASAQRPRALSNRASRAQERPAQWRPTLKEQPSLPLIHPYVDWQVRL